MTEFDKTTFDAQKDIDISKVTEKELKAILELPATYACRFYLSNQENSMIRLVFIDETPGSGHMVPRASIILGMKGFLSFAQMLHTTAVKIAQQLKQEEHLKNMITANANTTKDREELN